MRPKVIAARLGVGDVSGGPCPELFATCISFIDFDSSLHLRGVTGTSFFIGGLCFLSFGVCDVGLHLFSGERGAGGVVIFVGDIDCRTFVEMSSAVGNRQEGLTVCSGESTFFGDLIGIFDDVRFGTCRRRSLFGLPLPRSKVGRFHRC
jgi:hypothetical protein